MNQKKTNKTQVSDVTKLKQKIKDLREEVKQLKKENKKLTNQKKELEKLVDNTEQFITDCTEHMSLEDALKVAKKNKRKKKPNLSKKQKLIKELQDEFGKK